MMKISLAHRTMCCMLLAKVHHELISAADTGIVVVTAVLFRRSCPRFAGAKVLHSSPSTSFIVFVVCASAKRLLLRRWRGRRRRTWLWSRWWWGRLRASSFASAELSVSRQSQNGSSNENAELQWRHELVTRNMGKHCTWSLLE